jgi:hypothetical protein
MPHDATLPTSPTKSGSSSIYSSEQGRKARPNAEVAAEARGGCRLLPAEEWMFVADAALRVPCCRQTDYYHFRRWRLDGRLRRAHDRPLKGCARRRDATGAPAQR